MATRPVFIPNLISDELLVTEKQIEFNWAPGFARVQKEKNVSSLHKAALESGLKNLLEVSTKSKDTIGKELSAFNLKLPFMNTYTEVESIYQGSKVYEGNIQYTEYYQLSPKAVKKQIKTKEVKKLIGYRYNNIIWDLEPKSAFYDWIYINAVFQNSNLVRGILEFEGFTDIEFNPAKSINCQARACALFVSLVKHNMLQGILTNRQKFIEIEKRLQRKEKRKLPPPNQTRFSL